MWVTVWGVEHGIQHTKKTPKLVAKILATKFGFVPDCTVILGTILTHWSIRKGYLKMVVKYPIIGVCLPTLDWWQWKCRFKFQLKFWITFCHNDSSFWWHGDSEIYNLCPLWNHCILNVDHWCLDRLLEERLYAAAQFISLMVYRWLSARPR